MGDYAVTTPAYVKMLLHAAKRPANSVCGLLLGQEQGQGFSITDVVPLFHHEAPLAPLLEVGCSMADVWSQQTSKKIVGFYYAGSGSTPAEGGSGISHFAEKVADKVEANCSRSCVLVVDNQQLNNETKIGLQLLLKDVKRGWTRVENRLHVASGATKMLSSGLQQGIERDIVDFEDHLEDTAKDWRNPHVVSLLKLNEPPLRVLRRRVLRAQELVERLKAAATGLETVDKRLYNLGAYYKQQSEEENAAQKVEISRLCVQRERKFSACEALKTELETMNATSGLFPEQELAEIRRFLARVKKKKAYRKRVKSQRRAERSICRAVGLQQSEELLFATEDKAQENTQDVCEKSANDHEDREEKITTEPDEQSATNLSAPVQSAAASFLDPETLTINALISIRRVWDSFIVYAQTPGASTIPPHFIPPPPKPSAQWSAYSTAG
ncbi:hypothetical protein BBO99_00009397 [Phytophthora kernoviae]|uniref:MPN domain-containing protein n=2 Tax=Phytophthora kernoviae TaxID=325452 RepID=A0A421GCP8_9STRA|nr:hypothetical protein G195_011120 [Phytophthora kernoviae 00238/432]KAG2506191.1 hypothetical protein JM18_009323 [Phytophthora kernoviae]RLN06118.1 hypothetical protein BBI17_009421 [Phytophthora kernoviae]RLN73451.1 hypothetical protein BBO99_00009397 [Phytophthora kernoviae]